MSQNRRRTSFNPHPAFRPGDASPPVAGRRGPTRFNPHPAFRPGDAPATTSNTAPSPVSIRTRPFGRVMLHQRPQHRRVDDVSIRTRPFGRVMQCSKATPTASPSSFNPHPAFRPGDAQTRSHVPLRKTCFNPHPAFRPGDALAWRDWDWLEQVSIRTRPFGRVMRRAAAVCSCSGTRFNPHPAFRPGDAHDIPVGEHNGSSFNPHPAFRPGDAGTRLRHHPSRIGFNPHPAFRPGDAATQT